MVPYCAGSREIRPAPRLPTPTVKIQYSASDRETLGGPLGAVSLQAHRHPRLAKKTGMRPEERQYWRRYTRHDDGEDDEDGDVAMNAPLDPNFLVS